MNKRFICLVCCKPYDSLKGVIEGVQVLREEQKDLLSVEPYVVLEDFDQISKEEMGDLPEIKFGTLMASGNGGSAFIQSVENQILKEKNVRFVFLGGESRDQQRAEAGNAAITRKVKESIREGLSIILGVQDREDAASLREEMRDFFSGLGDEERAQVSIVYQMDPSRTVGMKSEGVPRLIEGFRKILAEVGGEVFANQVKILFSISKYTPRLLTSCLNAHIDGVCLHPRILPARKEGKIQAALPEVEEAPLEEIQKVEEPEQPAQKAVVAASPFLSEEQKEGDCLMYCHPYDDIEQVSKGVEALIEKTGRCSAIEYLLAVPFSVIEHMPSVPDVECGVWDLSFANVGSMDDAIHFDLLKERGCAFIALGDCFSRGFLKMPGLRVNQQLKRALSRGIPSFIGIAGSQDLKERLESILQGISADQIESVRFVLNAGVFGESLQEEAEEIARQAQEFRSVLEEIYGKEAAKRVKVFLEVSRFSADPFAYLSHLSLDGIALSASAIKAEGIAKNLVEKREPVEHEELIEEEAAVSIELEGTSREVAEEERSDFEEELEGAAPDEDAELAQVFRQEEEMTEEVMEAGQSETRPAVRTVAEGMQLVKLTVDACAERIAEKHFQETYFPNDGDLESPAHKLERMKHEYKKMFEDFRRHSAEGWEVLLSEMERSHAPERDGIVGVLCFPLERILQFADVEGIGSEMEGDRRRPWSQVIGLSKEQIDALYQTARGLFEKKRYQEAVAAFFTLVSLNAQEYGMWFGYAMAKKLENQDLEGALDAFSVANSLKPKFPEPYLHAAACYLQLGNRSEAERCLRHGKKLLEERGGSADLKEWSEQLSKKMNKYSGGR